MCTSLSRRLCAFTVALRVEFQNNGGSAPAAFNTLVAGWGARQRICSTVPVAISTSGAAP